MLDVYGTRMIVIFWQVVQTFEHKHLYNVSQIETVQYNGPAY
jgi:hypothetical protein